MDSLSSSSESYLPGGHPERHWGFWEGVTDSQGQYDIILCTPESFSNNLGAAIGSLLKFEGPRWRLHGLLAIDEAHLIQSDGEWGACFIYHCNYLCIDKCISLSILCRATFDYLKSSIPSVPLMPFMATAACDVVAELKQLLFVT